MTIRVLLKGPFFVAILLKRKTNTASVAKKAVLSCKHIQNVIAGRRALSIDAANRIQKALTGVAYDDLFKIEMEETCSSL